MHGRARRVLARTSLLAVCAGSAALAGCDAPERVAPPAVSGTAERTHSAGSDLDSWLERLDTTHPEPFHAVTRADFVAALADLESRLADLTPAQAVVGVMRVAALLSRERDGHQFALPQPDAEWPLLPLRVYEFADGVFVTEARAPYEDMRGVRLVAIEGRPITEVLDELEPLVPRDGPATVPAFRPSFLLRTVVLRGLGIVPDEDDPAIELTVADDRGERTVVVEPITFDQHVSWAGEFGAWRLPARSDLRYLSTLEETMSYEYLPETRSLYVRYTEVAAAGQVVSALRERTGQADVGRIVLDVRQNPGGDNHHNAALVDLLVERRSVPTVVLTDRVTFSAASNLVTDIEQATDAVFVGEAMGGGLNFWNDVDFVQLDALPVPMMIGVSTRYWQRAEPADPRLTIEPDVPVPVRASDFFAGRDPALEAALGALPSP
jgi:hypothetical protein